MRIPFFALHDCRLDFYKGERFNNILLPKIQTMAKEQKATERDVIRRLFYDSFKYDDKGIEHPEYKNLEQSLSTDEVYCVCVSGDFYIEYIMPCTYAVCDIVGSDREDLRDQNISYYNLIEYTLICSLDCEKVLDE